MSGPSWATARWTSPSRSGAISLAGREKLDNLIFVVNCNLQRLDGPVRGNGKIIQELEAVFRGAGWNVIKVIWGANGIRCSSATNRPAAEAHGGGRRRRVQNYKFKTGGAYTASTSSASTRSWNWSKDLSDEEHHVPPAAATIPTRSTPPTRGHRHEGADGDPGQDGQGLRHGRGRRGRNITHSQKKLNEDELRPSATASHPHLRRRGRRGALLPPPRTARRCVHARAARGAGRLASRAPVRAQPLRCRSRMSSRSRRGQRRARGVSTTMAFVRMLAKPAPRQGDRRARRAHRARRGPHLRHGGLFRQLGIYSHVGQRYEPVDPTR
jgi:pyruvate dehydrogenase E1 component